MELRVLGPVEVAGGAAGADAVHGRDREVLVALALHHGETVPGHVIADLLWPGDRSSHSSAIKTYVLRLRRAFGSDIIDTVVGGYRLADDRVTVDAATFGRELQTACGDDHDLTADERARMVRRALERWRGRPYDELGEWPAAVEARRRLEEWHAVALEARSDDELEAGTASIAVLEQLVAAAPLRERRWQQLMLGLYRAGRQAEALRAFTRARQVLRDEIGIDPGQELVRLEHAILTQDACLGRADAERSVVTVAPSIAQAIDTAIARGDDLLRSGEPGAATTAFLDAASRARAVGDHGRLMRAAVGVSGFGWNTGLDPHAPNVELLNEVLTQVSPSYSPRWAQVLARAAVAHSYHEPLDVSRARAREALKLARLLDDPPTLAIALEALVIVERDPAAIEQRRAWADELAAVAANGPPSCAISARWAQADIHAVTGDIDAARASFAALASDANLADLPYGRMVLEFDAVLDRSRRGDWAGLAAAFVAVRDAGARMLIDPSAPGMAYAGATQLVGALRGEVGTEQFDVAPFPLDSGGAMIRAGAAQTAVSIGHEDHGREILQALTPDVFQRMPRDLLWPSMVWSVSEAAAVSAAADVARALYAVAVPYRAQTVINPGGAYVGSMEHHLGVLALAFGDADQADGHFVAAARAHERAGATDWSRRTAERRRDTATPGPTAVAAARRPRRP